MLAAIFQASYNYPNHINSPVGGVCGTAFFMDGKNVLTANHILNLNLFKPSNGFSHFRFWLLLENGRSVVIEKDYLKSYPDIDTTKICFPEIVCNDPINYKTTIAKKDDQFILKGFLSFAEGNPNLKVELGLDESGELIINSFDLNSVISTQEGIIEEVENTPVDKPDVKINNKKYLRLSCGGSKGLSGAPLIKSGTGEVMGLMSFGLPADVTVKTQLFAISIDEVEKEITSNT